MRGAHRISWLIHRGRIPEGRQVLHKCDTPSCVNPDHLFIGTHQDNMDDMKSKGRQVGHKGEQNGSAKLTDQEACEIKLMLEEGHHKQKDIAKKYDVSTQLISAMNTGIRRIWSASLD